MNLVSLNIESIQLGHPLPFVLRGADGVLLAQKGYVIRTREELAKMVGRGRQLCVDTDESGDSHRAYLAQLQRMLIADTNLGEIAAMKMTAADDAGGRGRTGKTLPADTNCLPRFSSMIVLSGGSAKVLAEIRSFGLR